MQKAGWLCCCALLVVDLQGATFSVTSTWDFDPALPGTLRQAIIDANGALGDDTIQILAVGTIVLVTNLPAITDNTTIIGPGTNLLTISASNQFGVFAMTSGTINILSNLAIADGTVTNTTYPARTGGGGISNAGSLKLTSCVISNCAAWFTGGGGIYNPGDLLMQNCEVTSCSASYPRYAGWPGGGIANEGELRMEGCVVSGCRSGQGGGIYSTSNLFLTNCIIADCWVVDDGAGGGIGGSGTLTVHSCTISGCSAWYCGGIACGGTAAITNSTLVDNSGDFGGGIGLDSGTNVMVGCAITGNNGQHGGGIYNAGVLSLFNCTISHNSAGLESEISNGYDSDYPNATIYMDHCTIVTSTNPITVGPFIGGVFNGGVFYSQNSVFAGVAVNGIDFSGVLISEGYNLIQNTNGCTITNSQTGDICGLDPLLGPLQDNGGPTWTHALLSGSPCIDQGTSGGLSTDPRGMKRPYDVPNIPNAAGGDGSDIGAYEWTPPHSAFRITPDGSPTPGSAYALTITAVDQYQNTSTLVTGDHTFAFAGLAIADDGTYPTITDKTGASVNLGTPTTITFTNGVSSAGGSLLAYKAETATLTGSDATSGKTTSDTGGTSVNFTIANVNPVAGADTETRDPRLCLKILKSKLVGLATDANHDVLSVSGVEATSTGGATLSTNATYVVYLPNSAGDGDTFTYTVSDGNGGTNTGTVTVHVAILPGGPSGKIGVSGGAATVTMFGIPGFQYDIQRSTDLNTWTTLTTAPPLNTAPPFTASAADGSFSFTDSFSDLGSPPPAAYYRLLEH